MDQRLIDPDAPDEEESKVNACLNNIVRIYKETENEKLTQVVFCDLSTPKASVFNVYDDLKKKLIESGVRPDEIAFIQDAGAGTKADKKKQEIFEKVKTGEIRVLIGSTAMMGTGANMQDRLYALHHLDCPWRPSDMEQRNGRIVRFGNLNKKVKIYKYLTEGTFDAYMYQILENKQKFISQVQSGTAGREYSVTEDKTALNYAEAKALCTENPLIKEKIELDMQVVRLRKLAGQHKSDCYAIENKIRCILPKKIKSLQARISDIRSDMESVEKNALSGNTHIKIQGRTFENDTDAMKAFLGLTKNMDRTETRIAGEYRGFPMKVFYDQLAEDFIVSMGKSDISVKLGAIGIVRKLENAIGWLPENIKILETELKEVETELEEAREKVNLPFIHEEELQKKEARLKEVNSILEQANRADIRTAGETPAPADKSVERGKKEKEDMILPHKEAVEKEDNVLVYSRPDNEYTARLSGWNDGRKETVMEERG